MEDAQTVTFMSGNVEAAGHYVRLRVEVGSDGKSIDLRIPTTDLSHVVNLLLLLGSRVPAPQTAGSADDMTQAVPLPLRGVSLGSSEDGEAVLLFEVGSAMLAFSLAPENIARIGHSLLAMSAPTVRPYS
jgi:hypothetical protein